MSRKLLALPVAALIIGGLLSAIHMQPARGADVVTDKQLTLIRNNCTNLKVTLTRIQNSDLSLRINRDYVYQAIANQLMVPLNQRIASNQLDGTDLIAITADFKKADKDYYNAYKSYANAMSNATSIDCTRQPSQFYDAVAEARKQRKSFYQADQTMVDLMNNYRSKFTAFSKQVKAEQD